LSRGFPRSAVVLILNTYPEDLESRRLYGGWHRAGRSTRFATRSAVDLSSRDLYWRMKFKRGVGLLGEIGERRDGEACGWPRNSTWDSRHDAFYFTTLKKVQRSTPPRTESMVNTKTPQPPGPRVARGNKYDGWRTRCTTTRTPRRWRGCDARK